MKESAIRDVVTPAVERCGLEVDRIDITRAGRRSVLRISLDGDGPAGRGPSLDQITDATRAISAALDASPVTGSRPYTLEVSSRGVSRPLTEPRHYRRNLARLVKLDLVGVPGVTGRITGVADDAVDLDVDGEPRRVALADITRAVVQVELTKGSAADEASDDEEE